jgi:hypothetical protein
MAAQLAIEVPAVIHIIPLISLEKLLDLYHRLSFFCGDIAPIYADTTVLKKKK